MPADSSFTAPIDISNVIFDFGGVLLDWRLQDCLQGRVSQQLIDTIGSDSDPYGFYDFEDRMDAGENFADLIPEYRTRYGDEMAKVFTYYIAHYQDSLPRVVPGMERLMEDLRAHGIGLWGLTNWSHETFHVVFEKFPQLEKLVEGTIVSGVEKVHKPEAAIFQLALDRFSLEPTSTVFFDDKVSNVEAARNVGIRAFSFHDARQARADLISLRVNL